jgi:uracil-DNA glycosylase
LDEISNIQPNIILACGSISTNVLLGKKLKDVAWENRECKGIQVIAFPHPSSAGRDGDYLGYENRLKSLFRFVIGLVPAITNKEK